MNNQVMYMIHENPEAPDVELHFNPVINYAMQQNHVPIVRTLIIKNTTKKSLDHVSVEISFEPDFVKPYIEKIDSIAAGQNVLFKTINTQISTSYLYSLTEKQTGSMNLVIKSENSEIYNHSYEITFLAYDQWSGMNLLPEMLSAFITPNHPAINAILKRASEILHNWTGSPSFDEYQTRNPNRVKKQMAAIYEAISEAAIVYCSSPASFEDRGQRVRLCDTLLTNKLGTCLDMSLLYASCLEAVGINPLLVILKGHAFAGGWLIDDTFADQLNDDPSLLSKRLAEGINEIQLIETTCMNAGSHTTFDEASNAALLKLNNEADFLLFIDVKRSRFSGICPIATRVQTETGWRIAEDEKSKAKVRSNDNPEEISEMCGIQLNTTAELSKQAVWERKLLDLSLRNNLLNIRLSKNTLQLISVGIDKLEDALQAGEEFQILPKPNEWNNPLQNAGIYQSINGSDPIADLVKKELTQRRIRTYLSELELSKSLTSLYRSSRLSMEENGANTLYLALGMLKWYEAPNSERPRFAPLLLLPVEIIRKSAAKGFVVRGRDEEMILNISLIEMLRQDFNLVITGLDTLPKDETGIDVKLIFNLIRKNIMNQKRWDVVEQSMVGIFSFNKFIMWNDIHHNADKLCQNKLVSSLMSGKLELHQDLIQQEDVDLDNQYTPAELLLPISADSSQMEAITAAIENKSIILHGPPGTGKSQTITNIIANALYRGKRVLFVAEKMAALAVVQKRLETIGLAPFCLELHSNKAKKANVLEQLKNTTEVIKGKSEKDFQQEALKVGELRSELNKLVTTLHRKHPSDLSLYDALSRYLKYETIPDILQFNPAQVYDLYNRYGATWEDTVQELQSVIKLIDTPFEHPLSEIKLTQYSTLTRDDLSRRLEVFIQSLHALSPLLNRFTELLHLSNSIYPKAHLEVLCNLSANLRITPYIPESLLCCDNQHAVIEQIKNLTGYGLTRDKLRSEFLSEYHNSLLTIDAEQLLSEWNIASAKWFLPKLLTHRRIKQQLKTLAKSGRIEENNVVSLLENLITYQNAQKIIDDKGNELMPLLGMLWKGGNCDWNELNDIVRIMIDINYSLLLITKNHEACNLSKRKIAQLLANGCESFREIYGKDFIHFESAYKDTIAQFTTLGNTLNASCSFVDDAAFIGQLIDISCRWNDNLGSLKDWIIYQNIRNKAISQNLTFLIEIIETKQTNLQNLTALFNKSIFKAYTEYIISSEPELSTFNGSLFEDKINKYRQFCDTLQKLTHQELYLKLAMNIPSFEIEAAQSSEVGILQRNIRNNGRGTSIRKLFDSIPTLLTKLSPCMLMSPISVAQYLDAGAEKFDLVVFDEASQMPTCEAVGAIARGHHVIVVGDPQQMPPTNFFSSNYVDEENIDKEDLESILDDCLALSIPSKHLLWHYRSKHESLIAFSNAQFYKNKLRTFPSPDDLSTKVTFKHIQGYYDKGKTRQNRFEAEAIIAEIKERLLSTNGSKRSIGVVTFSSVQQSLIEDLLNECYNENPELEKAALECDEPIFIKNLENVQGDERDVILFSIGYGPDENGNVSLNFGPINREGGGRRLNVAVSRARYEMKVFSTLKGEQINMNRTSSKGVEEFKSFLEYAEKGKSALTMKFGAQIAIPTDNYLENSIAENLRSRGFEVNTNIGYSGFKIDLAIVNPQNKSEYLLGILCDGYNYSAAKTARDRDIVQPDVLSLLGWNIHRVWSLEWWENKERALKGILDAIEKSVSNGEKPEKFIPKSDVLPIIPFEQNQIPDNISFDNVYEVAQLESVYYNNEDFTTGFHDSSIRILINQIIDTESPVSKDLVCKKVLASWGIARKGVRISAHFDRLFKSMTLKTTRDDESVFFWKTDHNPEEYSTYRSISDRDALDIPSEEVANAVKEILTKLIGMPKEKLVRETALLFGFQRMGEHVQTSMLRGIDKAIKKGFVKNVNEQITIN